MKENLFICLAGWRDERMAKWTKKAMLKKLLFAMANWDLLPKFLSLKYYTIMEDVLGVQRSRQAQDTIMCLFGMLFSSQNGMAFKKTYKNYQNPLTIYWFLRYFSEFVQFRLKNSGPNQLDKLKLIILLLLTHPRHP